MKNKKIKLIKKIRIGKDKDLNVEYKDETKEIFAEIRSVYGNEFYTAGTQDIKPEAVLIIYPFEYSSEKTIEYDGKRYEVIRTYEKNINELEITIGEKIGD